MSGILELAAQAYHDDRVSDTPSLSKSIAHLLCTSSAAHVWQGHPRLNPDFERQHEDYFDIGTYAHRLLLEPEAEELVDVVEERDWKKKLAQATRDASREAGRVPLLTHQWEAVRAMVASAQRQLAEHRARPRLFTDGKAEQTLVWQEEDGIVCRARLDWLRNDLETIDDYKTTSRSADPGRWTRSSLFAIGGDIQAAFYRRGLEKLAGVEAEFRFVVQETFPPFALAVISPGPDVLTLGEEKVDYALRRWTACLNSGEWEAYPRDVCYAELPPWEETRWLERTAEVPA